MPEVGTTWSANSLLIVIGSSVVVLHERVTLLAWIGAILVAGGLVLVVLAQNSS